MKIREIRPAQKPGFGAFFGPHYEARVVEVPDGQEIPAPTYVGGGSEAVPEDTPVSDWTRFTPSPTV